MTGLKIGLPVGIAGLLFGQTVAPEVSPYLQGGGLLILGAVCWRMLAVVSQLSDAINALRIHCASLHGQPTSLEIERARLMAQPAAPPPQPPASMPPSG